MDWLSRLLEMLPVRGVLDRRCEYDVAWRLAADRSEAGEIPYHIVLHGTAMLQCLRGGPLISLGEGDILLLLQGDAHVLYGAGGPKAWPLAERAAANSITHRTPGKGERP